MYIPRQAVSHLKIRTNILQVYRSFHFPEAQLSRIVDELRSLALVDFVPNIRLHEEHIITVFAHLSDNSDVIVKAAVAPRIRGRVRGGFSVCLTVCVDKCLLFRVACPYSVQHTNTIKNTHNKSVYYLYVLEK